MSWKCLKITESVYNPYTYLGPHPCIDSVCNTFGDKKANFETIGKRDFEDETSTKIDVEHITYRGGNLFSLELVFFNYCSVFNFYRLSLKHQPAVLYSKSIPSLHEVYHTHTHTHKVTRVRSDICKLYSVMHLTFHAILPFRVRR